MNRLSVELREFDATTRMFEAVACTYNVTDSYRTRFIPGVFTDSLRTRLPDVRWGHDPTHAGLVGNVVDYRDDDRRLEIIGQLLAPGDTPHSRQAYDGLRLGVLDEFSVGFDRLASRKADDGVVEITKANLLEVSIVMTAAVPGSDLIAVRSRAQIASDHGPIARRLAVVEGRSQWRAGRALSPTEIEADALLEGLDW